MVSCEDLLMFCRWQDQERLCSDLFEMRPTDDGICCGFNPIETGWNLGKEKYRLSKIMFLNVDLVNNNKTISKRLKLNEPERVHLPGYRIGLTVALDNDLNDWASTTGRSNGWKVRKRLNEIDHLIFMPLKSKHLKFSGAITQSTRISRFIKTVH